MSRKPLEQGIPQGITLGPILFNLFMSPLGGICWAQGIKFAGYTDDTQNYMSFRPLTNSLEPQITCINKLESCLADVRSWMQVNFLKLNESKTEFIIRKLNSLQQDQFLLVTQAFTSPPDMASSGVWENVIFPKTPTFEGVSGILYYIIFLNLSFRVLPLLK